MIENLYEHFLKHPVICTDTRDIKPDSIFFALKGENFNANKFAEQAINVGCSLAVVDEKEFSKGEKYLLVDDVLKTLQQLSNFHRRKLSIPIIGITGTNGKTTTKELVKAVLSRKYNVLATKGNLNNHIGVPLTLLSINQHHEVAIVEMGANHQGEIEMLCKIAEPCYGMITNIGKAHLEGFGGEGGVVKAKSEMYKYIKQNRGKIFVNDDNELLKKLGEGIQQVKYGTHESVDYLGVFIESNPFVKLKIKSKNDSHNIGEKEIVETQLVGKYNFENILSAACIGNYFGVNDQEIKQGLENYVPSNNRSQVVQTKNNLLLLDAYNANPSSMQVAIENFAQMDKPNKMVILGDMLELGQESEKEHLSIVNLLNQKKLQNIIFVGPNFSKVAKPLNFQCFQTSEETGVYLKQNQPINFTILIKGSRGIKLETVTENL